MQIGPAYGPDYDFVEQLLQVGLVQILLYRSDRCQQYLDLSSKLLVSFEL